ncbi:MAG: carboxypeptidase regulatory-like domain-containing protein, partial [Planctomycetota bacterium]
LSINDVKVDKNGYFTLKHITPGNYSIASHIDNPGIASRSSHKITQARFPLQSKDELLIVTLPNKSPQQHVTISGRFVSTNTRRLKNVSIIASSPQLSPRLGHWFKKSDDPNNSFVIDRLEPGNYNLSFSGSDIKAVVLENVKAPSEGLVVELEYVKKSTIRGIVINPQTTDPVKDFKLRIKQVRSFGGHGQPSRWNEFSTDDGQFQIASVSPGIYQLQILADGFALTKSDDIDVTEHNFISIELKKGGSIKGIVTDAKDAPVKGAKILPYSLAGNIKRDNKIIFDSEQGAVATNTDGSFIIENLTPGNEILKVTHPDYCSVIKEDIEVIAGQITEVKFVLNTGGAIEGYLYDENGKPQPNVALLVYEGFIVSAFDKAFTATVTDANGYYYIDVLPEEICQIKRNNEWSALGVTKIPIVPLLGKTLRIDIGKGTNIIGQLIVDSQPLPNTRIMVSGNYGYHSGIFRYNGLTDSQGNFKLRGIIQGSFSLYYPNPVKQNHWVKFASFEVDSRDIDLGIVPKNFATVFVNITQTSKEHPFSIVKVPVQEGVETYGADIGVVEIPETETQPYIIKNLLPGTHTLIIERSDYTKFRREFEITEDSQQLEIDFEIPECNAGFSAKVFNSKSTHLNFWSENYNLQGTIIADQNDEFKADNLPADTYYFGSKRNDGDHYITAQLILGNGEQKTIDIDMDIAEQPPKHDGYRAIVVVNENGLPLNTRDLWIDNGTERFDIRYHTDYLLCFIGKQGKYTLHANIPGYKDPAIDFQLNPAPTGTPMNKIKPFILRLQKKDLSPKTIRQ